MPDSSRRDDFAVWAVAGIFVAGFAFGYLVCSLLGDPNFMDLLRGGSP